MVCERRGAQIHFRLIIVIGLFMGGGIEGVLSLHVSDFSAPLIPRVFLRLLTGSAAWLMSCERTGATNPCSSRSFQVPVISAFSGG